MARCVLKYICIVIMKKHIISIFQNYKIKCIMFVRVTYHTGTFLAALVDVCV